MLLRRAPVSRFALCAVCALALARPARSQNVYIAGGFNQFGTMNLQTGAFSYIGQLGFANSGSRLAGMAFDANGVLYGIDETAEVFQINTATAAVRDLGSVGADALSATIDNGKILILDHGDPASGVGNRVFSTNLATMTSTLVGDTGLDASGLFASDGNGHVYMGEATNDTDVLHRVDTATAATTPIGDTHFSGTSAGLFANGVFYAFGADSNNKLSVLSLNTTTGAGTLVSHYSIKEPGIPGGAVFAAAFRPVSPVPEMGEIAQFAGLFVLGSALVRRRRVVGNR